MTDMYDRWRARVADLAQHFHQRVGVVPEVAELNRLLGQCGKDVTMLSLQNSLIMNAAGDGICGADAEGKFIVANLEAARLTGYTVPELLGRALADLLVGALSTSSIPDDSHGRRRARGQFRRLDGAEFPVEYVWNPIRQDEVLVGAVLTFNDISARLEIDRVKNELLGALSHDLRTPAASLVGFTELLLTREYTEAERREFLTVMLREGQRLTALIKDLEHLHADGSLMTGVHDTG